MDGLNAYDLLLLGKGFVVTLLLCFLTMIASIPLAFLVGLIRSRQATKLAPRAAQACLTGIINLVRGTPLMLQLVFLFFGLPFMGVNLSPLAAAAAGLAVYSVAYLSEIARTGVESVAKEQWEAAATLGMRFNQAMVLVILPQAVRIMIPPSVGFFIGLIKDSSLCAVIGFVELARVGRLLVEKTHLAVQIFLIVAVLYFAICYPLSKAAKKLEQVLNI